MSENVKEFIKGTIILLIVLLVMLGLRKWVFTSIIVEGSSMYPSLEDKQKVFGLYHTKLERFDIVTFPSPYNSEERFVKRIIGMPGDTLEFKDDVLYINGKEVDEPYLKETRENLAEEALPLTANMTTLEAKQAELEAQGMTFELTKDGKIPEGKLFVMGDNRQHSTDSRFFGYVNESDVVAEVKFRYWPLNKIGMVE